MLFGPGGFLFSRFLGEKIIDNSYLHRNRWFQVEKIAEKITIENLGCLSQREAVEDKPRVIIRKTYSVWASLLTSFEFTNVDASLFAR